MKETFDDEKLYSDQQEFGPISVRNYGQVVQKYDYRRYVHRFRTMAQAHRLVPGQRPKLDENQFASLMKQLTDALLVSDERKLLQSEQNVKIAFRLLLSNLFDEDWCEVDPKRWTTGI